MKILINRIGNQAGGINRRAYELAKFVSNQTEHELVVVGIGKSHLQEIPRVKDYVLEEPGWQRIQPGNEDWTVPRHLLSIKDFSGFVSRTVEDIEKIIDCEKPDICFNQGAFYLPWAMILASKSRNLPIVQMYCGSTQTEVFFPALKKAYWTLEKEFQEFPSRIVFNSGIARSAMGALFSMDFSSSSVIYNGFPSEYMQLEGSMPDTPVVGWCGRNVPAKNMGYLLRLREYIHDVPIQCLSNFMKGDQWIRKFEDAKITIVDPMAYESMDKFYRQITCLINTSSFEFFSNVASEALSAGRIPIVTRNNGISGLLAEYGISQCVVDLEDRHQVEDAIMSSNRQSPIFASARKEIMHTYSWNNVIGRYIVELEKAFEGSIPHK